MLHTGLNFPLQGCGVAVILKYCPPGSSFLEGSVGCGVIFFSLLFHFSVVGFG
jgi:hypothetical protein